MLSHFQKVKFPTFAFKQWKLITINPLWPVHYGFALYHEMDYVPQKYEAILFYNLPMKRKHLLFTL